MSHWIASVISSSPRGRRFDLAHRGVDVGIEEVDADDREVRRRVLRLLDELDDLAVVVRAPRRPTVADPRRARAGSATRARGRRRRAPLARSASNASTNSLSPCWSMLSPRYITKSSSPRKSRAISTQCARPERRVLAEVGDVGAPPGAVADRGHDLVGGVADDDPDLLDPGFDHVLDAVEEDRLVGDRHELLRAGVRDRPEAGAGTAGEDETLHRRSIVGGHPPPVLLGDGPVRTPPPVGSEAMSAQSPDRFGSPRGGWLALHRDRPAPSSSSCPRDVVADRRRRRSGIRGSPRSPAEVAELRGLEFEHPVPAEFLDDAAFEKRVTVDKGKLSKADKDDIERSQGQLRAVGLIGPAVDLLDATSSLQTSGVLAYYSPQTKKITVKGKGTGDVATRVTVAHELTHALQDQHFDLRELEKDAAKTPRVDPACAHWSRATRSGSRTTTSSRCRRPTRRRTTSSAPSTSATAQSEIAAEGVPESLSVFFEAPYSLGPTMSRAVIAEDDVAGVERAVRRPADR